MSSSPLSQQLRTWRKAHRIKQQEVASRLGVTQAAVSRWENDLDVPSALLHARLTDLMARSIADESLVERVIVERQAGFRAFSELDGVRLAAVSASLKEQWPQCSDHEGQFLADFLCNEPAHLYFDDSVVSSVKSREILLISGVSEQDLAIPDCPVHLHRWTLSFRRLGTRHYIDWSMELCEDKEIPRITEFLRMDDVARR